MDIKKFWNETFGGFVLKNILIALSIVILLSWLVLLWIGFYTGHGDTIRVPDLRGLPTEEAKTLLKDKKLGFEIVDSVYVRSKKLGTIVEQNPAMGTLVKSRRLIYVTINTRQVAKVALPDIHDMSYRQADATLRSVGLEVSRIEYVASEYKDLVQGVKYLGNEVLAGMRLPEGSAVVLVVGMGVGSEMLHVPELKGMNLDQATALAKDSTFFVGYVDYDVPPSGNELDYAVYRQLPEAGSEAPSGSRIFLYLSKDKSRTYERPKPKKVVVEGEEDFF